MVWPHCMHIQNWIVLSLAINLVLFFVFSTSSSALAPSAEKKTHRLIAIESFVFHAFREWVNTTNNRNSYAFYSFCLPISVEIAICTCDKMHFLRQLWNWKPTNQQQLPQKTILTRTSNILSQYLLAFKRFQRLIDVPFAHKLIWAMRKATK